MNKKGIILFSTHYLQIPLSKEIIKYLLDYDYIETIIELPSNILPNTAIKTSLILLNKNKNDETKEKIKFINSSLLVDYHTKRHKSVIDIEEVLSAYYNKSLNYIEVDYNQIIQNDYRLKMNLYTKEILKLTSSLNRGEALYLKDILNIKISRINLRKLNQKKSNYEIKGREILVLGIPIVSVKNLNKNISDIFLDIGMLKKIDDSEGESFDIITTECILIARVGSNLSPTIFKPTEKNPQIIITDNIYVLMAKDNILLEYLYYQLYEELESQILATSVGSLAFAISLFKKDIEKIIIPKKNLDEQKKYVEKYRQSIIKKEKKILEDKFSSIGYKNFEERPLIITEGKTDWKHLKKALERFKENGLYRNLDIQFEEYENTDMGDGELDRMVQTYCKTKQSRKHIFIFDRDNNTYVNKYAKEEFNNHKNNVYSFCIPKISDELDRICIEFYYKKDDLRTEDKNGKRIFLGDEFYPTGNSKCAIYITPKRKVKALDILDSDKKVYLRDDIEWKENVALSKNNFTNNIITDIEGFNNFDIENFRLIFDVIEKIVKD